MATKQITQKTKTPATEKQVVEVGKKSVKGKKRTVDRRKLASIIAGMAPTIKSLLAARRKMELAKEGYLDVKDTKTDFKVIQSDIDSMMREVSLARESLRAQYVNKPFLANLWGVYSTSSSASTALTAVTTITVSNFVEWSTFSGLFDLARCIGMTIHTSAQAAHATAAPEMFWNCAYDPESPGVYASIENCLAAAVKTGVKRMSPNSVFVAYSPQPVDNSGMYVWKVPRMPPILPDQSTAFTVYSGDWFDTANSTIILGYLKPYIPSASGVTTAITHYVEAHMEFKLRT